MVVTSISVALSIYMIMVAIFMAYLLSRVFRSFK
jgi:hypothetical protein